MHVRRLNDILHLSIEREDFSRARRAWAILARCKEFDWKTKWRTGLLLLSDNPLSGQHHHQQASGGSVEFLKKFMRYYPDEQESVLQETILHLTHEGKFREALDELDLYLPSFPFQESPFLLAYAGLISFRLAISSSDDKIQCTF
ncbi:hypothetical protein A7U60_g8065 [Sanghuangporus baumii]|uniref:Uncharacterized protein n=1 Tax=Sanghuangporus baumii TaxID=108892 RepID=A0A9Q5N8W2_SANBA|nr:hypothetical protein A7U60_g8065 [Sanghuangporus baumii]